MKKCPSTLFVECLYPLWLLLLFFILMKRKNKHFLMLLSYSVYSLDDVFSFDVFRYIYFLCKRAISGRLNVTVKLIKLNMVPVAERNRVEYVFFESINIKRSTLECDVSILQTCNIY